MKYFDLNERIANAPLRADNLWDYQQLAIAFGLGLKKSGLFLDLGLGKTGVVLKMISDLLSSLEVDKVLVVSTLRVVKSTWPEQMAEWDFAAGYRYTVLSEDPESRKETKTQAVIRRSINSTASIHLVNMEMLPALVDHWRRKWPYQMVVIDESSKFKDYASIRFKKLNMLYDYIEYLVEMSATPAAEGYEGLFSQIALLDHGERLGKHISHYRSDYFDHCPYKRKYTLKSDAKEKIDNLISDITLVMKAEDYLPDYEKPHFIEHKIKSSDKFLAQYREMERENVLSLGDVEIVADNAAAVWGKLLQMASGMVYETWDEPHPTRVGKMVRQRKAHLLHDEKLDELEELADQLDGKPILVGYYWEESLERLKKRFPKAVVLDKDGKCIKDWNKGKIKMMLAHPQSAGHGLNLQKATQHMCFFDLHPSLENFLQFIGRLNRQGKVGKTMVHLLLMDGTYDMRVWSSLREKEDGQEKLLARLRYLQRKMREKILKELGLL